MIFTGQFSVMTLQPTLSLSSLRGCTESGWGGVNFLHSSPLCAVLCICSYPGVGNTPMFWMLLSSPHSIKAFVPLPPSRPVGWLWAKGWAGTQLGQLTQADPKDISYHMMACSAIKAGEGRVGNVQSYKCLSSQVTDIMKPSFPGHG